MPVTLVRTFDTNRSLLSRHADLHLLHLMAQHLMSPDHWASFPFRHCYPMLWLSLFPYSAIMRHLVCFTLLSERRPSKAMNQAATRKKKQCASIVVSALVLFCWFSFWYVVSRKEFALTPWPQWPWLNIWVRGKIVSFMILSRWSKTCTWQGPASWFQVGSPKMVLQYESRCIAPY